MSSNQRKPSIQPRATKASLLRLQKQQGTSSAGLVSHTEAPPSPQTKSESLPRDVPISTKKSSTTNNASASDGVKAFMAQQRARLAKKPAVKEEEEPVKRRTNVMTGAQRYGGGSTTEAPVVTQTRNIQIVIKQAKAQGKLNLSSRGLTEIPKEVLQMYHVDPNSIVVDFNSDGAAWYDAVELTKFIAGDNAITVIDERLGEEFGALTHIDFRNNKLTALPQSLKLLQNLTSVLLPYNQFEEIPKVLAELSKLRELDLSHNQLENVILNNSGLEKLDLSYNKIKSIQVDGAIIDDDVFSIRTLDLAHNQIESLPDNVIKWKKLQELKVNQNKLKFLFSATSDNSTLPSLIRLDAGNNLMAKINGDDKVIISMPELAEFSLSNNKFDEEGLIGLHGTPNVRTLDISSNQLQYIPASVTNLIHLQRIDVRGNQLHALPYELGKLSDLKAIQCEGNPMRSFTSMTQVQLIESLRSNYKAQLEEEDKENVDDENQLEGNDDADMNTLNINFTQKVNITKRLDLSKQDLQELPNESMKFTEDIPGIILLNNNTLTVFPSRLNTISTFIVQLNLEHNKLTSFDLTIHGVEYTSLRVLKLSNNRIGNITCDGDTVSFPALEELHVNHNALTTLPDNLPRALPALKLFALSSNKLDNITDQSFGQKLENLDLSNNDIGYLPPGLSNLGSLKQLSVYGNRFRVPRPAVVDQGTQAILDFLRRRNNANN